MRMLLAVAGGVLMGVGGSWITLSVKADQKYREKYEEQLETHKRVLSTLKRFPENRVVDGPVESEEELTVGGEIIVDSDGTMRTPTLQVPIDPDKLDTPNDYHKAMAAVETDVEKFVAGGVNDYGISYIEEEEYYEEDGRFKGQITIFMDDHNPIFTENGERIDDWDQKVGDSILVDFYKLVPPGLPRVLFVRNHRTDSDYEVLQEVP